MHVHPSLVRVLALSDRFIVMPEHRFHQLSRNLFNRNLRDRQDQGAPLNLSLYIRPGMGSGTTPCRRPALETDVRFGEKAMGSAPSFGEPILRHQRPKRRLLSLLVSQTVGPHLGGFPHRRCHRTQRDGVDANVVRRTCQWEPAPHLKVCVTSRPAARWTPASPNTGIRIQFRMPVTSRPMAGPRTVRWAASHPVIPPHVEFGSTVVRPGVGQRKGAVPGWLPRTGAEIPHRFAGAQGTVVKA